MIRRAQGHDREAVDALFTEYAPIVRRGLRRILGERYRRQLGDSEDAAQDALIAAFEALPGYEHQGGGSFLAWLLCIAERQVWQRLRSANAEKRGGGAVHVELEEVRVGAPEELDGVLVFAPDGDKIGRIKLPERCANVCFGGPRRNRLFMAASQSLYAVYVNTQGVAGG